MNQILFFHLFSSLLLLFTPVLASQNRHENELKASNSILNSRISCLKGTIPLALNVTQSSVQQTYLKISILASTPSRFTPRANVALNDCLELLNQTAYELNKVADLFREYRFLNNSVADCADDLNILLSAAITNQHTCLDGFSHDKADRKVRNLFIRDEKNVVRLCRNALAMIKKMTDKDLTREKKSKKKLVGKRNGLRWPKWMSAGDWRLFQATTVTPDVVVAADGGGHYRTISEAVDSAPKWGTGRYIIKINAGVYRENVNVPKYKTKIMFIGEGKKKTFITGNRNVVDGGTTYSSATVAVAGEMFLARDINFHNSAGPSKKQAVALRVESDRSAFYRCSIIAFQDTLYAHTHRQFFIRCVIIGTIDFIFGNAAVVFQNCNIHARRPNPHQKNMITAQGRHNTIENTGIVIQKCRIRASKDLQGVQSSIPTYLGRPWKKYSRTIVMQSEISDVINPAGWYEWRGNFALDTLEYREYLNFGPGANVTDRVSWKGYKVMTSDEEAKPFTAENFISGGSWLESTGFPFSLGL